jgi:hypothetical protein
VTGRPASRWTERDWADYEVIVIQQPRGRAWVERVRGLQAAGAKVVFEIDDYVHACASRATTTTARSTGRSGLRDLELAMRVCDAMICSTPFLGRRYRAFNPTTYVCRNGLDLGRYALTLPQRDAVHIGWSGATGHRASVRPWLDVVAAVMRERGRRRASCRSASHSRARWRRSSAPIAACPSRSPRSTATRAAMASIDVAIAPAGRSNFFRGKSDCGSSSRARCGTRSSPTDVYTEVEDGVTGYLAETPAEACRVCSSSSRTRRCGAHGRGGARLCRARARHARHEPAVGGGLRDLVGARAGPGGAGAAVLSAPPAQPSRTKPIAPPPPLSYVRRATWSDELPSMVWMRPSGSDVLDHADVLVPHDQVAGLRRRAAGAGSPCRSAGPSVDVVDAAEALAAVASGTPAWRAAQETK